MHMGMLGRRRLFARSRWATFGALGALIAGGGLLTASASSPGASSFVPITPCRLFDTRADTAVGTRNTPLGPGETMTVASWGTNGNCTIPTGATGLSMNIVAVNATSASFLTVFPGGGQRPLSSSLNWVANQPPTPNAVTVSTSSSGTISLYNNGGSVDLAADIVGFYEPSGSGSTGTPGPTGPIGPTGPNGATGPSGPVSARCASTLRWDLAVCTDAAITLPAFSSPWYNAFDGTNVWTANFNTNAVSKVNVATSAVTTIPLPSASEPIGIAFDGTNIWTANRGSNNVTRINASTNVATTFALPALSVAPRQIAFDGTNLWITLNSSSAVTRMPVANPASAVNIQIAGSTPEGIAFDGTNIWVADTQAARVIRLSAITLATPTQTNVALTAGFEPIAVAFDGTNIWVSNRGNNSVSKITRIGSSPLVATISLSPSTGPEALAFDGTDMWVANFASGSVSRVNIGSNAVATITLPGGSTGPSGLVYDGTNMWVTAYGSNELVRLVP